MDLKQDAEFALSVRGWRSVWTRACQSDVKELADGARNAPQNWPGMFRKLAVNKTIRQRRRFTVAVSHTW